MARIRSIKPETFDDELLGTLPRDVRLLFVGLWTLSDDDGRFRANPALIRSALFPYDQDLAQHQVGEWLNLLAEKDRILLYEVAGQQYGVVLRWLKHQRIDHPSPSRLPPPPKGAIPKAAKRTVKSSRGSREFLANPPETLAPDQEGKGRERKGEERRPAPASDLPPPTIGRPTGIGVVAQAWEAMGFAKDLANSGGPRTFVEAALSAGVPASHLVSALHAAKWFVDEGIAKSLQFTWERITEETPLNGTFRWASTDWPGEDMPSSGRVDYDPLEGTAYEYAKKPKHRIGRRS